jgi:GT2 family glycosyltransferase
MKNLTIIIVAYNSSHIIKFCLENIDFERYDVMIVDNASSDETIQIIQENFHKAKIIKLEKNVGYGNGNNAALRLINTEFALILNPDAIIFKDDIEKILTAMKNDETVAIGGSIQLTKYPLDKNELKNELSKIQQDLNEDKKIFYEKIGNNVASRFLVGCAMVMRMSIFKKIGFFDENIFLFAEDSEVCKRSIQNGYKNLLVLDATAFHIGGGAKSSKPNLRSLYKRHWHFRWSKFYFKKVNKGYLRAIRSASRMAIIFFSKTIVSAFKFNSREFVINLGSLAGTLSFLIGLKAFKKNGNARG